MSREFHATTEHEPGIGRVSRYRLTCGACGTTGALGNQSFGSLRATDVVPKKFTERGWEVGKRPQDDRCPGCVAAAEAKRRAKLVKPAELAVVPASPREMQREDRRIILAKLNEVYLDEQRGYDNGWTDHRVAEDLGVPRKWVEELREQNFGPAGDNEGLRKFRDDVLALASRAAELEKQSAGLLNEAKSIRDALRPLERQVAGIAKMTGAAA